MKNPETPLDQNSNHETDEEKAKTLKIEKSLQEISKLNFDDQKAFEKIKTAPSNRWYNSIMCFLLTSIFVLLGVIVVCLIVYFA